MSDPNELISVYEAANSTEAQLVKNMLAEQEIEAQVSNEHQALAGLGFAASDVYVARKNEVAARAIIDEYEQHQLDRADRPDWVCAACSANVIGAFDECDVCGAPRDPEDPNEI